MALAALLKGKLDIYHFKVDEPLISLKVFMPIKVFQILPML